MQVSGLPCRHTTLRPGHLTPAHACARSDPHVSRLFDEDVGEADQGAPGAPAAAHGVPALPARGLEHITSLTRLKKLSLQGSCCWRILFGGRVHSLMALTSVTQPAIDMHAPDAYRTVRAPRYRSFPEPATCITRSTKVCRLQAVQSPHPCRSWMLAPLSLAHAL